MKTTRAMTGAGMTVAVLLALAHSASADVVYSTNFADLSGWSTYNTPANVKNDTATDGRSAYYNDYSKAGAAIVQRPFALTDMSRTPTISWTLRRNDWSTGNFRVNLLQSASNTHAAGDVQMTDLYLTPWNGNVLFIAARFNNAVDATTTATTLWNTPLAGGHLPPSTPTVPSPVVADYITFTLTLNTAGTWTLTDSRQPNDGFALNLGTMGGAFEFARLDLDQGNGSQSPYLVSSFSIDANAVPEPASIVLLGFVVAGVLIRRHRRPV